MSKFSARVERLFYHSVITQNFFCVISSFKRHGGFTSWPEVRITRMIDILSGFFLESFFYLKVTLKKAKTQDNLSVCPQMWTLTRLTYKRQKYVCDFLFRNIFSESDLCAITSHFLNTTSKMCYTFSL